VSGADDLRAGALELLVGLARGGEVMARQVRKSKVKEVPLSQVKDDLSRYLREAEEEPVVITRHGKPAGVLVGFESEDDWFDYQLENDPRFLARVERARASMRAGRGVRLEDV
jgi:prevent-host-death family protein